METVQPEATQRRRERADRAAPRASVVAVAAEPALSMVGPLASLVAPDLATMSERGQFAAWQSLLESVSGSALEAVEACEAAVREIEAMRLRALALIDAAGEAAVSHVWDERAGAVLRQERSRDLSAARRSGIAQVATRLRCSEGQVASLWDRARVAVREHPEAVEALARGDISARHLEVVVDESASVPSVHRRVFAERLVEGAATRTPAQLRAHARKRRELTHPDAMAVRHRQARATRHVSLEPGRDGMSWLTAHLPTVAAAAVYDRVTAAAVASQGPVEQRTLAQLRADVLVDYCLADAPLPALPGVSATAEPSELAAAALGRTMTQRQRERSAAFNMADDATHVASPACDADLYGVRAALAVTVPHTLLASASASASGDARAGNRGDPSGVRTDAGPGTRTDGRLGVRTDAGPGTRTDGRPGAGTDARLGTRTDGRPGAGTDARLGTRTDGDVDGSATVDVGRSRTSAAAELVGHGPIDDDTAAALLAAAPSLRRILTDPHTGIALDMSRDTYVVPAPLRAFLRMRDQTCRFPGCRRSAARCDVDHVDAWADGGTTDAANLAHLCRSHHRLKHLSGWQCETVPDVRASFPPDHDGVRDRDHSGDGDPGGGGGEERGVTGRLRPSALLWTDPQGHISTTEASLGAGALPDLPPF